MNVEYDNYQDLIEQLDAAGRLSEPADPGWDDLLDRLPPRPRLTTTRDERDIVSNTSHSGRFALAISVLVLLVAALVTLSLLVTPTDSVIAQDQPIEVRRGHVAVTVFNASDQSEPTLLMPGLSAAESRAAMSEGIVLVKDQRQVLHLKRGRNVVKFADVAATIDPTSVRLVSNTDPLGTKVVEQNFEFDLASADALLKRALEQSIECVGRDDSVQAGVLISFDSQSVILADHLPEAANAPDEQTQGDQEPDQQRRPRTMTIPRSTLRAIRLEKVPADLHTRPTLVWVLQTDHPGNHETTLTYICGRASWQANYVAVLHDHAGNAAGELLDLQGWVTIRNSTGTTYENAQLKLIAGDVNRVRDPWAQVRKRSSPRLSDRHVYSFYVALGDRSPKEFVQKDFFEYKLYTLNQPSTVRDRQVKQLSLFRAAGIQGRRRYVCGTATPRNRAAVQLLIQNDAEHGLGQPLPQGQFAVMAIDADGDQQLLNRVSIEHTAKGEELVLPLGYAADVTKSFRVVDSQQLAGVNRRWEQHEMRVRNHRQNSVKVRVVARLDGNRNWSIAEPSDEFRKHDFQTIHFDFELQPDSEKTITYTVDYRW